MIFLGFTCKLVDRKAVKVYYILVLNYTLEKHTDHSQSVSNSQSSRNIQAKEIIINLEVT